MKYIETEKRLIMNTVNLQHMVDNIFSYGYVSINNTLMSLFNEMVSCGCISVADRQLPPINVIEIRLRSEDTIGVKSKFQKTRLKKLCKE